MLPYLEMSLLLLSAPYRAQATDSGEMAEDNTPIITSSRRLKLDSICRHNWCSRYAAVEWKGNLCSEYLYISANRSVFLSRSTCSVGCSAVSNTGSRMHTYFACTGWGCYTQYVQHHATFLVQRLSSTSTDLRKL